jgi:hypothetical protein
MNSKQVWWLAPRNAQSSSGNRSEECETEVIWQEDVTPISLVLYVGL